MTDPNIPVTEDELHAYVDNELPAERRGDVETWLASHPDDAARVQSWRTMAEALHARYDSVIDEAVPKRLDIERLVRERLGRTLHDLHRKIRRRGDADAIRGGRPGKHAVLGR